MDGYNDPGYVQAKNDAATAYSNYGTAQNATLTMPDMLKSVLDKKFASNDNPLNQMRENAYGDYAGAANTGYQAVLPQNNQGMIFDPSSQQEQIQGRRNSALVNILGANRQIESGLGGITNIIDSATKSYQAQENSAKTKAELARQKVSDLFAEIEAKEKIRQFNETLAMEKAKIKSSNGSDLSEILALVAAMQQGQGVEGDGLDGMDQAMDADKKQTKKEDYKLNLGVSNGGFTSPSLGGNGNMTLTTNPKNAQPKPANKTNTVTGAHAPTSKLSTFKF